MASEIRNLLGGMRRAWLVIAACSAGLEGLWLLAERISVVGKSPLLLYGYAVIDVMKIEFAVLLAIALAIGWWTKELTYALRAVDLVLRRRWEWRLYAARVVMLGVVVLACALVGSYEFYWYARGKKIAIATYATRKIYQASEAFGRGHVGRARFYLRVASEVGHSDKASELASILESRMSQGSTLRRLEGGAAGNLEVQSTLIQAAVYLDRDTDAAAHEIADCRARWRRLSARLGEAIGKLATARVPEGVKELKALNAEAPGFGDCQRLLQEVVPDSGSGPRSGAIHLSGPYSAALARLGPVRYCEYVMPPHSMAGLDSLEAWVRRGAPCEETQSSDEEYGED